MARKKKGFLYLVSLYTYASNYIAPEITDLQYCLKFSHMNTSFPIHSQARIELRWRDGVTKRQQSCPAAIRSGGRAACEALAGARARLQYPPTSKPVPGTIPFVHSKHFRSKSHKNIESMRRVTYLRQNI